MEHLFSYVSGETSLDLFGGDYGIADPITTVPISLHEVHKRYLPTSTPTEESAFDGGNTTSTVYYHLCPRMTVSHC
jgi:hypothetical protein